MEKKSVESEKTWITNTPTLALETPRGQTIPTPRGQPSKHPRCLTSMQIGYGQKNLEAFSKLPAVFLWKGWTFVL